MTRRRQRGSSLAEVLVSLLFVSLLTAISYSFARAALMATRLQAVKSDAQAATVLAIDVMARELRMAGFNAAGSPLLPPLRTAAADRIEVVSDLNGDGDVDDSNEQIAYQYDDDTKQVMRATGGASPQPFIRDVAPAGFRLTYFDGSGAEVATESAGMPTAQRLQVHRVDVTLQVEIGHPDPNVRTPVRSEVSTSVCLRNQ